MRYALAVALVLFASTASTQAWTPAAGGTWTHVRGGTWVPDADAVAHLKAAVHAQFVVSSAEFTQKHGMQPRPWGSYAFQYQGITLEAKRIVFVNALCRHPPSVVDYAAEMVVVKDGASCYFRATFDPVSNQVTHLRFNGL